MDRQEAMAYVNPDRDRLPFTLVMQPPGSRQCGQAVVATIMSLTLEESVVLIGKTGLTTLKDLDRALQSSLPRFHLGPTELFVTGMTMNDLPDCAIVKMHWINNQGRDRQHWLLWTRSQFRGGRLLCPAHGQISPTLYGRLLSGRNNQHPWLTSFAEVIVG